MQEIKGLNLVLLGKTGAGKSSTGNTILGKQAFKSRESSRSVTRDVAVESGTVGELPVTVYDTPGLFDTDMSEEEILQKYDKVLQKCESGPCVFLLVIKADRFSEEERKTVEKIEELLGENRLEKTWILFTRGDELEEENMTIHEFLDETQPLKNLVQKYDQRYHVFNNKKRGHTEQVKMLFIKIFKPYFDKEEGEVIERLKSNQLGRNTSNYIGSASPADSLSSRRIVLLGKTGFGKSAAGNTILGQREFDSVMRMNSVTSECSDVHATVSGRSVSVVDTPGLFDTKMNPEELMMEIARSVYLSSPGPHAFLIVFPITMKFTDQEQQIPEIIKIMFGEEVLNYSIILFTHGDQLEEKSVEELIEESCRLRHLVQQCGDRYHIFNNKDLNNREQVNDLLQKIDTMIEQNGGGHYSNLMFEDALRFRQEEEEQRQREEEERKQQEEKQIQEEIERVRKETEERIRAEYEAKAEKQSEEERKKQAEEQRKEFEREMKKEKERIRAEYEAEQQKLKAERQKEEKRIQDERVKKEDGFMQFFSKHKRYFFWGAVVVGVAFGGAALGAYVAKALSGAAFAKACGVAVGGVVGGAAAGAVGGIASGEGASKGAAAGAVVGTAVVGAIGGAYVGAAAAKALSGAAAAKACGVAVGGAVGGAAAGAVGVAAGGKDIVGVIDQTVGGNVA